MLQGVIYCIKVCHGFLWREIRTVSLSSIVKFISNSRYLFLPHLKFICIILKVVCILYRLNRLICHSSLLLRVKARVTFLLFKITELKACSIVEIALLCSIRNIILVFSSLLLLQHFTYSFLLRVRTPFAYSQSFYFFQLILHTQFVTIKGIVQWLWNNCY